ncbi:MAG: hypothetical protein RLZZ182_1519, partial [Pseudomonadota bacterium]
SRVKFEGDGSCTNLRVRHVRCTSAVPFNPVAAYTS